MVSNSKISLAYHYFGMFRGYELWGFHMEILPYVQLGVCRAAFSSLWLQVFMCLWVSLSFCWLIITLLLVFLSSFLFSPKTVLIDYILNESQKWILFFFTLSQKGIMILIAYFDDYVTLHHNLICFNNISIIKIIRTRILFLFFC